MSQPVTVWYFEMSSPAELRAAPRHEELELRECELPQFQLNRFLYQLVGGSWGWTDKLVWSDEQWRDWTESPDLRTWIAWHRGAIAGYFELHRTAGDQVEIAYFGLAPGFIGRGFGGDLLSRAIGEAWGWGAGRVWLHTCSLDHASALPNYRARGFRQFDTKIRQVP